VVGSKSSGSGDKMAAAADENRVVFDHRYMPTSPTCDVARNIELGDRARLVTGDVTRKQSISLKVSTSKITNIRFVQFLQ